MRVMDAVKETIADVSSVSPSSERREDSERKDRQTDGQTDRETDRQANDRADKRSNEQIPAVNDSPQFLFVLRRTSCWKRRSKNTQTSPRLVERLLCHSYSVCGDQISLRHRVLRWAEAAERGIAVTCSGHTGLFACCRVSRW